MTSILISTLAVEHDLTTLTARAYLRKLGIKPHLLRDSTRGNQLCGAITQEQSDQFRQWRDEQGFDGRPVFVSPWERSA